VASLRVVEAEGWYRDPFAVHTDRWFSDGRPTALVRDGDQEGHDPPPDGAFSGPLVEAAVSESADGDDLRRADEAEAPGADDAQKALETALDSIAWGPVD
jgi:hypothetical protein